MCCLKYVARALVLLSCASAESSASLSSAAAARLLSPEITTLARAQRRQSPEANTHDDSFRGNSIYAARIRALSLRGGAVAGGETNAISKPTDSASAKIVRKKKQRQGNKRHKNKVNAEARARKDDSTKNQGRPDKAQISNGEDQDSDSYSDSDIRLGSTIRTELRDQDPLLQSIDWTVSSLGYSMGASDHLTSTMGSEGGGVEVASTSVITSYFLKSHGGVHLLQCVCSLLATASAAGAIALKTGTSSNSLRYTLLRRTMIFAMIKHCFGLFAAASLSAKAIPKIGLARSRLWIDRLVRDPVSQYVFYAALMLLWLPRSREFSAVFFMDSRWAIAVLVGPILLREVVSNILVASDMLVLSNIASSSRAIDGLLGVSKSVIDAVMSLVVSPDAWRNASSMERQAVLAKIVSRLSLAMEVAVGAIMIVDFARDFGQLTFSNAAKRTTMKQMIVRLVCVRLYLHFLWIRRRKLATLAVELNNGASQLPMWALEVLLDPLGSMGIQRGRASEPSWVKFLDYTVEALGLDQR